MKPGAKRILTLAKQRQGQRSALIESERRQEDARIFCERLRADIQYTLELGQKLKEVWGRS